jgi:hypothetical protein
MHAKDLKRFHCGVVLDVFDSRGLLRLEGEEQGSLHRTIQQTGLYTSTGFKGIFSMRDAYPSTSEPNAVLHFSIYEFRAESFLHDLVLPGMHTPRI